MGMTAMLVALALGVVPGTGTRNDAACAGGAAFTFTFKAQSTSQVHVYKDGVEVTTGFTKALNANQDASPGGTVTFNVAPTCTTLRVQRETPKTQSTVYTPYSSFPAKTTEKALDSIVMQGQEVDRRVGDVRSDLTAETNARIAADAAETNARIVADSSLAGINIAGAADPNLIAVTATGSTTARSLAARFADVVNVKDFGAVGNGVADDTAAIQAAIDAAYGRRLVFPRGDYLFTGPLVINAFTGTHTGKPLVIEGQGFDGNGGSGGTILRNVGTGRGIEIINSSGASRDNLVELRGFALIGDGTNASGGTGIYAAMVNNLNLRDLWVQGQREHGIYLSDCWGANLDNVTILRNRKNGLYLDRRFNMGVVRRVRSYSNGRIYDAQYANIFVTGAGTFEHLGARFEQVDVSYGGTEGFISFRRDMTGAPASVVQLTSIAVASNVGTVTTAAAHTLSVGNRFAITGATVDPDLNTRYTYTVATVPNATSFTFSILTGNVSDGTYTESSLKLQPSGFGLFLNAAYGVVVANGYAEDCADNSVYVGSVTGFEIQGGYFQNQLVQIDAATNGKVTGGYYTGVPGGLVLSSGSRTEVDVSGSNVFTAGAREIYAAPYKKDGIYRSTAAPASGTWVVGDRVINSAPAVGQPKSWACTVAGTPGTWVSEGNL